MKLTKKALIRIPVIIIILIIIFTGVAYYMMTSAVKKNNAENIKIEIPLGTGTNGIARILKENNLIRSEMLFKIYVKLNKISNFQAGTYYLNQSMNTKLIVTTLQTGTVQDPNQISITYLEGKNVRNLAKTIANCTDNTEEQVFELLEDNEYINSLINEYWFLTEEINSQGIYYPLEGYLFPDTYMLKNKQVTVQEIFKIMLDQTEKVLEEYKSEIEGSNYTVHEILTMASIIEMESINVNDRKNVASVIYNRINLGMAIQSDVTTYYAFNIDMGERDLYQTEINSYNPYNTRGPQMEGKLPIGPISSVSKTSIEAAIRPNQTDYLFFVADKTGKVYFTKTNSEHNQIINKLEQEGLWYEY